MPRLASPNLSSRHSPALGQCGDPIPPPPWVWPDWPTAPPARSSDGPSAGGRCAMPAVYRGQAPRLAGPEEAGASASPVGRPARPGFTGCRACGAVGASTKSSPGSWAKLSAKWAAPLATGALFLKSCSTHIRLRERARRPRRPRRSVARPPRCLAGGSDTPMAAPTGWGTPGWERTGRRHSSASASTLRRAQARETQSRERAAQKRLLFLLRHCVRRPELAWDPQHDTPPPSAG